MNNWPKFLPHPASWARGFALSSGFWLIVSLLPGAYYYYSYGWRAAYWLTYNNSREGAIAFAWACQIPLFAFYHWGLTKVTEWVEIRRHNQPPPTVSAWLHWREGIIAFLTLPAAIVMGIPAIALLMLPVRGSSGALVALILGTAISSAYLYHFRVAKLFKILLKFFWIFYANLLKTLQILLVPAATGTPFFILTIVTATMVPRQLMPLTIFVLVVCVLLSGIVGYAALQYWSAHLVNWAGTWWPVGSPGYSRIQARKAWKHNKTAIIQSFVRHSTSWHLAANDGTYLIYFYLIALGFSAIGYFWFGEHSEWLETEEEMLGSATALAWVALWHFWGWRSEVAIASSQPSTKTSNKRRSSNARLPAADPVELELNQMSAELGNTRMRPVRKSSSPTQKSQSPTQKSQSPTQKSSSPTQKSSSPTQKSQSPTQKSQSPTQKSQSEQPQWYVFRSGKAEGPYTKDQLRDVQKITDRTKVRRGQTEWQRAGEISELALFLTQK